MKARWFVFGILTAALVLAAGIGFSQIRTSAQASGSLEQAPQPGQGFSVHTQAMSMVQADQADPVPENIVDNYAARLAPDDIQVRPFGRLNYQGQMLQDGNLINTTLPIVFSLYTVNSGGTPWWTETQMVDVEDGLFNVMLGAVNPLNSHAVNFQSQQWLGIQPDGAAAELSPRQPLGVVASAMNLMPGATMVDESPAGVYGYSFWVSTDNHSAIYGQSDTGTGVTGLTSGDNDPAIYGSASGDGSGSHGLEARMSGATASCVGGDTECGSGLYATASGNAYATFIYGENRSSVVAIQGDNGYYGFYLDSLISPNGQGIWTDGASHFNDFVTFSAGKSGYVVDIALNDGAEVLEQGDIVVISGFDSAVVGEVPVVRVRKASEANATGVIGVVDVLYVPCQSRDGLEIGQACGGFEDDITRIQPGEYLGVVTLGAYKAIKVEASSGAILPGDLLATSAETGFATKARELNMDGVTFYAPGTIIGKALGRLDSGSGTIPVFVSSR